MLHPQPQGTPSLDPMAAPSIDERLAVWARARGGRLLVVDDSATNRALITALLRKVGFSVEAASDGVEAIHAVANAAIPFDAVLMDVSMPGMDGLTATRKIRAMSDPPMADQRGRVPIIAVTAHGFPEDRVRSLAAGMNEHLVKPVRRADLLAALARWLDAPDAALVRTTNPAP
ncbi:response regulator [Azospirillum soli]|uniref:response regulator n=1 Tax=Azospirillum soli TaxID=1304799 RepID=UPI001AE0FF0C|nr:response regulator [Azospirillum soli]MBP2314075.1 CheY-like chemotaxis protein [Azospirillum soli]